MVKSEPYFFVSFHFKFVYSNHYVEQICVARILQTTANRRLFSLIFKSFGFYLIQRMHISANQQSVQIACTWSRTCSGFNAIWILIWVFFIRRFFLACTIFHQIFLLLFAFSQAKPKSIWNEPHRRESQQTIQRCNNERRIAIRTNINAMYDTFNLKNE